ncbi:MAG TPA: xanthine dehydrogenase family protein subunit M [Gemmatimonadaceae bacterium]|jgi:xanthine dehydrogenase YagS FAD-binding subunit
MQPFSYSVAGDVRAASRLALEDPRSRYLAGGTTLVDLMKLDVEQPTQLIDISKLPLAELAILGDGGVRIGAMVRNSDLAHNEAVRTRYPVLSQAVLAGASGQVRNMATTAGNLLQRTRCSYFRDTATPCNKRDAGSGCSAIGGYNRMHAVLGTSDSCIATHPSDMAVALVALDARVRILGPGGERIMRLSELYRLPGQHPERETTLEAGDLIMAVEIPPLRFASHSLYLKVRDRASFAFALASAAVALDVVEGTVREARVALGGVGTRPWRSPEAEQALRGQPANVTSYRCAADAALAGALPRTHNAFKIELARRTLVRALLRLEGR